MFRVKNLVQNGALWEVLRYEVKELAPNVRLKTSAEWWVEPCGMPSPLPLALSPCSLLRVNELHSFYVPTSSKCLLIYRGRFVECLLVA